MVIRPLILALVAIVGMCHATFAQSALVNKNGQVNTITQPDLAAIVEQQIASSNLPQDGWFDRYGLENAAKCVGQVGTTYATLNGTRANLRLSSRDYLIQQNRVNDRKGHVR